MTFKALRLSLTLRCELKDKVGSGCKKLQPPLCFPCYPPPLPMVGRLRSVYCVPGLPSTVLSGFHPSAHVFSPWTPFLPCLISPHRPRKLHCSFAPDADVFSFKTPFGHSIQGFLLHPRVMCKTQPASCVPPPCRLLPQPSKLTSLFQSVPLSTDYCSYVSC